MSNNNPKTSSGIFRKDSVDRVSSPEQLNDYVKVSGPGVWIIMASVIILLAGVCVWGFFGHLDTKLAIAGVVNNGQMTCYIKESDVASVSDGMKLTVGANEYQIEKLSTVPEAVGSSMDSYLLHVGNLQEGEWVYTATVNGVSESDGVYAASIITESVSPMSFIMN